MARSTMGQDLAVIVWIYTGLIMRCAHAEVDGVHVDAAGVNGKGMNADGARGVGARGVNVDWGVNAGVWWMVQPMV